MISPLINTARNSNNPTVIAGHLMSAVVEYY